MSADTQLQGKPFIGSVKYRP